LCEISVKLAHVLDTTWPRNGIFCDMWQEYVFKFPVMGEPVRIS